MSARPRFHLNVLGPFYVEDGCCTHCGVPDVEAPELFAEAEGHCYVQRQPATPVELERMLSALSGAELRCIRYAGDDPQVLERLALLGLAEVCDSMPPHIAALRRDHVSFELASPSGARELLAHLLARYDYLAPSESTLTGDAERATLTLSWWSVPLVLERGESEGRWLLRGIWGNLSDWLASLPGSSGIRWYNRGDWEAGGTWYATPW